jgi:hypothetical protein
MAFAPCDVGPHRHSGPNRGHYIAVVKGDSADRWSLRICDGHLADVEKHLAQFEVSFTDDATGFNGAPTSCLTCLEPTNEVDWELFITGYPAKNERKDYWSKLHVNCRLPLILRKPARPGSNYDLDRG